MERRVALERGLAFRIALADYSRRHPRNLGGSKYACRMWPLFLKEARAQVDLHLTGKPCTWGPYLRSLEACEQPGPPCPSPRTLSD